MGSNASDDRRGHVVCVPYPAQGHITPMLKLAKLLHSKGFYITFVNTEFNHKRLLKSRGSDSLDGMPDFRFEAISDGLPPSDPDSTQDIVSLCVSTAKNCLGPFCSLLSRINDHGPPVTCIVSDMSMSFTLKAAHQFGLPEVLFASPSACSWLGYTHYQTLVEKGYVPLQDASCLTNGYLETTIDWIPGMKNDIRLRDLPSFIRTTDSNDAMVNFVINEVIELVPKASAVMVNTFDALEQNALSGLATIFPNEIFSIGPLQLMLDQINHDKKLDTIGSNLWKEEPECIDWLNTKQPNSVVYVNFGSITVMTANQLVEFAWGLANSKKQFLWIIRPYVVAGESAMLPSEFVDETKDRGMLASWCSQEQLLNHPAIGGFLTHCGWNSTLESICGGVPMICWPFFADQQTNCRYSCVEWEIGMEIDNDVKRNEVEKQVRELMDGEKGRKMKEMAMNWKMKAEEAVAPDGSSYKNLEKLLNGVFLTN